MTWLSVVQKVDEAVLHAALGSPAWAVPLFVVATTIGAGWGLLALAPMLLRTTTRRTTAWLLVAIGAASGLTTLLKAIFRRARPCDALGWCHAVGVGSPGGFSLPSGHASGAFAFGAFVALRAPRPYGMLALLFAASSAWSRCALGVHYPSDVLAGAFLGAAVGVGFAWVDERTGLQKPPA